MHVANPIIQILDDILGFKGRACSRERRGSVRNVSPSMKTRYSTVTYAAFVANIVDISAQAQTTPPVTFNGGRWCSGYVNVYLDTTGAPGVPILWESLVQNAVISW